jgi:Zn-dependent protease
MHDPAALPAAAPPAVAPRVPPAPVSKPSRRGIGVLATGALFLLGKAKWLLAALKFAKFGTLLSMGVTIAVYAEIFGWLFAVGFVLLIFVHEMGHALAMRQRGIAASAPVFIPFVGAFIAMRGRPRDAWEEAYVGIGGPILGTVGAVFCLAVAAATGSPFWAALASVGFLLNLFNLLPVSPLDGGRIAGAVSRWLWVPGFLLLGAAFLLRPSPILVLIVLMGAMSAWARFKQPVPGYYAIGPWRRASMGVAYFGLIGFLMLGMAVSALFMGDVPALHAGLLHAGAGAVALGEVISSGLRSPTTTRTPRS